MLPPPTADSGGDAGDLGCRVAHSRNCWVEEEEEEESYVLPSSISSDGLQASQQKILGIFCFVLWDGRVGVGWVGWEEGYFVGLEGLGGWERRGGPWMLLSRY